MPNKIKRYKYFMLEPINKHIRITVYHNITNLSHSFSKHLYDNISAASANRLQKMIARYNGFVNVRNLPIISISFMPTPIKRQIRRIPHKSM